MFPWPRAFLHLLWSPWRVNRGTSVSCSSKDSALGIVRGAFGGGAQRILGTPSPPQSPSHHRTLFPEQEPRQAHGGPWGLRAQSLWRLGDRLHLMKGNRDASDPMGRVFPALRRVRCLHRASSLKETGPSEGLSGSGSGFSGAHGPRSLCSHGLLSPSDHRHLWEEPDPLRSRLHYQVPGPVHQLHLRLQHSHEGEGREGAVGGPAEAPHTMRLPLGTQAVEPGRLGLSPV